MGLELKRQAHRERVARRKLREAQDKKGAGLSARWAEIHIVDRIVNEFVNFAFDYVDGVMRVSRDNERHYVAFRQALVKLIEPVNLENLGSPDFPHFGLPDLWQEFRHAATEVAGGEALELLDRVIDDVFSEWVTKGKPTA